MSLLEKQKRQVVDAVLKELQSFSFTDKNFDLFSIIEDKVEKIIEIKSENISELFDKAYENKNSDFSRISEKFYLTDEVHGSLFRLVRESKNQICKEIHQEITSKYSVEIVQIK